MAKKELQLLIAEQKILNPIYVVRGQKIMQDQDLAEMYRVEARRLNEQVKRYLNRFPKDFMFTLRQKEFHSLMSQIATSSSSGVPYRAVRS
ncbi:ORF6N domain-containing protein [Niabella aurantiaca]|uniref:ORF6N domain-containing protein n=1 Tax=Niabella aurantiaca TaxID=379900 RepID=UPI00035DAC91|nr:ORF6N domain-containing protein [Niabella aurantiaca]